MQIEKDEVDRPIEDTNFIHLEHNIDDYPPMIVVALIPQELEPRQQFDCCLIVDGITINDGEVLTMGLYAPAEVRSLCEVSTASSQQFSSKCKYKFIKGCKKHEALLLHCRVKRWGIVHC